MFSHGPAPFLSAALSLLIWPGNSHSAPTEQSPKAPIKLIVRGGGSKPELLEAAGGIPAQLDINTRNHDPYSLLDHIDGPYCDLGGSGLVSTAYVSTSTLFSVANKFARDNKGYVHLIQATPNCIDAESSLAEANPIPKEAEVSCLGGIRWAQVKGWLPPGHDAPDDIQLDKIAAHQSFVKNPKYDTTFDQYMASINVPQLAPFADNNPVWEKPEWKPHKPPAGRSTKDSAIAFMKENGKPVGWNGNFPLMERRKPRGQETLPEDTACKKKHCKRDDPGCDLKDGSAGKDKDGSTEKGKGNSAQGNAAAKPDNKKVEGNGLLNVAQAYNSFLDSTSYFTPPDPNELDKLLDEEGTGNNGTVQAPEQGQNVNEKHISARAADQPDCAGTLKVYSKLTESYDSYLKTLDISASATVSGWGQSASISGHYLDHTQISKDTLTYVAIIDIERQQKFPTGFQFNTDNYKSESFNADFGDRWIRGFHKGGKMIARVSFQSKGSVSKTDLKAHAEASLKFWGVKGDLSVDVKYSMEQVSKNADVEVSLFYQGDLGKVMGGSGAPEKISAASTEGSFRQVKQWSDQFIENGCQHDYEYRPFLEEYPNAQNFPASQKILDYRSASRVSSIVLRELVKVSEMSQALQRLELDGDLKTEIEFASVEMEEESRNWVDKIAADPSNARKAGKELLTKFRTEFYDLYESYLKPYVSGVDVVYSKNPPPNRLLEAQGLSEEINHDFGGESVWIIPKYTVNRDDACSSFEVTVQDKEISGSNDLAKGAGGKFRYLTCKKDPEARQKIRRLALFRGTEGIDGFLNKEYHGYTGTTPDINVGRDDGNAQDKLH
ncbi:heat-labile enterotoxin alpha chain domain-containing protein [Hirsutella rhossiliensis]|uniref:Heat-labile enterotoxin alpha chain domain-containing protein n=1 Tax=Hirsutella rhossiliensis TaxID=111463 RepID=A0A9P8MSC2_9HYPO|nr:heat-labile enterotoxin alpha chain domain-containing protein [Hirsutella rhossiliensis]KAH0960157.1 heat-labile enterotoxin alpha chain domain-containing protein [Hirsutella rhossiliensis]